MIRGSLPRPALVLPILLCAFAVAAEPPAAEDRDLVLRAPAGDSPLERRMAALQAELRSVPAGSPRFEELAWMHIARARAAHDETGYRLAERCAALMEAAHPGSAAALLIKGHALHAMHRFSEAEAAGRALVGKRGLSYDYGLLGDALMEQGRLPEAREAYQAMMDRKPGAQAYARSAHLRWLHGDTEGAADMMGQAVAATSPRDPESLAWAVSRLGGYLFELGRFKEARAACARALAAVPGHAGALALRGRISLAQGRNADALPDLSAAARATGLPDIRWALADALRLDGKHSAAAGVESGLDASGERADPRAYAVFLATRKRDPDRAARLAARERAARGDAHTHDALAWTAFAAGDLRTADSHADSALATGIRDARLLLHGGLIARAAGRPAVSDTRLAAARRLAHALLPSERKLLEHAAAPGRG